MTMSSPRQRSAFTLIELLVVIAIIAVLIGLLLPAGEIGVSSEWHGLKAQLECNLVLTARKLPLNRSAAP